MNVTSCANCGSALTNDYSICPNCGYGKNKRASSAKNKVKYITRTLSIIFLIYMLFSFYKACEDTWNSAMH